MDTVSLKFFLLKLFAFFVIVNKCYSARIALRDQKYFKEVTSNRDALPQEDVISCYSVHSQLECSFKCLLEEMCVAYNYRHTNKKYSKNCQLVSNKTQEREIRGNGDWTFYQDLEATEKDIKPNLKNKMHLRTALPQYTECFGYKWLRETNRNQNYSGSDVYCDGSLSGWYRFGGAAGIKMPTSCVPKNKCGTHATGWMNGAHPTVVDGKVTRKVCYNYDGNCCNWSNNIEVVNCGQYHVYNLRAPSGGCFLRYCGSDN